MEVLAVADDADILCRQCVDCGWHTGNFCGSNKCQAADYIPTENWAEGQFTPLYTHCEVKYRLCHFCRRASWLPNLHFGATLSQINAARAQEPAARLDTPGSDKQTGLRAAASVADNRVHMVRQVIEKSPHRMSVGALQKACWFNDLTFPSSPNQ